MSCVNECNKGLEEIFISIQCFGIFSFFELLVEFLLMLCIAQKYLIDRPRALFPHTNPLCNIFLQVKCSNMEDKNCIVRLFEKQFMF